MPLGVYYVLALSTGKETEIEYQEPAAPQSGAKRKAAAPAPGAGPTTRRSSGMDGYVV